MNLDDIWKNLCVIHEYQKKLTLLGEEFGKDFLGFYQPTNELKNAYEHIIRARSQELGLRALNPETDLSEQDYIVSNVRKAMAHEYRAFFDTADFLSVTARDKIIQTLKPFSSVEISTAIPEYYQEYRQKVDEITYEIVEFRNDKDVGKISVTFPTVEKYATACEELLKIYQNIIKKMPILLEVSNNMRSEKAKDRKKELITKIIIAIIFLLLGLFLR